MKQAKKRVKIHTPYIICNDMMYDTWSDVAAKCTGIYGYDKLCRE